MDHFFLVSRGLFHSSGDSDSSSSNHTCPSVDTVGPTIVPLVGSLTFHQVATIVSGASAIAVALVSFALFALHAINYSSPVQQRQILRVILLMPWISLWSFLIVWQDRIGDYLFESLDVGCAIALSSFLLLMCDYVLSHRDGFDQLFGPGAFARGAFNGDSPPVLKRMWYSVLQFIPTSIIIWIATAISLAVGSYCKQSNSPRFAHIWITVFKFIVIGVAIMGCLRFYFMNKNILKNHSIFFKLFTFKGIIGLNALQTLVINILCGDGTLKPTKYITYNDANSGIASFILACEMPIFAVLLWVAFPVTPYKNNGGVAAGPISATVDAFNITDLLSAFIRGPMRLVRDQHRQILRQDSVKVEMGSGPAFRGTSGEGSYEHEQMMQTRYNNAV